VKRISFSLKNEVQTESCFPQTPLYACRSCFPGMTNSPKFKQWNDLLPESAKTCQHYSTFFSLRFRGIPKTSPKMRRSAKIRRGEDLQLPNGCVFRVSEVQGSRHPGAPICDQRPLIANHHRVSLPRDSMALALEWGEASQLAQALASALV